VCLELSRSEAAALAIMAETSALVGASLRTSPFDTETDDLFDFPGVRRRLTFTAEPAFRGSLALVVGVVQTPDGPIPAAHVRPLGGDHSLVGHFHAAAFSFRPFKKGRLVLGDTVRTLFEDTGLQGVLHLVNDNRPVVGVGQSEFTRGACWIGAIGAVRAETEGDVRRVYWFADKSFLGVCDAKQALPWKPTAGTYQLTALDDHGRSVSAKMTLR